MCQIHGKYCHKITLIGFIKNVKKNANINPKNNDINALKKESY